MSESGDASYSSDHPSQAPEPIPKKQCAPGEKSKFDGTDYPNWLSSNPYTTTFDDTYQYPLPFNNGDPWGKSAETVKDFDNGMCDAWVDEIQYMLVYAGLFSAVVGAFAVETQKLLQPDPAITTVLLLSQVANQLGSNSSLTNAISAPFQEIGATEALRINALMIVSLLLSLGVALVGIMVLQWIRSYRKRENLSIQDQLAVRQSRYDGLLAWKVPEIITSLPVILQLSLVLFFAGLIDFLRSSNTAMAVITGVIVSLILGFVVFTNFMPSIHAFRLMIPGLTPPFVTPFPAYQSPQSWVIFLLLRSPALVVARIWQERVKGIDAQFVKMRSHRWTSVASWKDFILSSDSTVDNPDILDKALIWLLKTFNSFESFCSTYQCLVSLTGRSIWTLHSVATKIASSDPATSDIKYFNEEMFSLEEPLRRQLCVQHIYQWDWYNRRRSNRGATDHCIEVLRKGLYGIIQGLDALLVISPNYAVHNGGTLVKAFRNITTQIDSMVAYTDFNDRQAFIQTWLFTFLMLLRSGALKFLPYEKREDDFNFDNFWRKLFKSGMDESIINECIEGVVEWLTDFDTEVSKETTDEEPDSAILQRTACMDGFISSLWYYRLPDLDRSRSVLLFVNQFMDGAKCRRAWVLLRHSEYTYAAPPWNKFMSSIDEAHYQFLNLPLFYGCDPDTGEPDVRPDDNHVGSTKPALIDNVDVDQQSESSPPLQATRQEHSSIHSTRDTPNIPSPDDAADALSDHSLAPKPRDMNPLPTTFLPHGAAPIHIEPRHLVVDIDIPDCDDTDQRHAHSDSLLKGASSSGRPN